MSEDRDILGLDDEVVAKVEASGGARNYVRAGLHFFEIMSVKPKVTQDGDKAVIIELLTLESDGAHKKGELTSRYIDVHPKKGLAEYKAFIAAVFGVDFDEVEGRHLRVAYSEKQPLVGKKIRCRATDGKTREKQSPFTYCDWANEANPFKTVAAPATNGTATKKSALDEAMG